MTTTPKIKILFYCAGNTCRSPMAEIIFKNICKKYKRTGVLIKSAGTNAEVGATMSPEAINALRTYGEKLPAKPHTARQLTGKMLQQQHYAFDLRNYPDPYGQGQAAYDYVCCKMQQDLESLYHQIFDWRNPQPHL